MRLSSFIPASALNDFCQKWRIVEFAVFGSVARGDARPDSDVDVLVTFAPDARLTLWDAERARRELESLLGRRVDMLDRRAVEHHHNPWMRHSILSDARTVYRAA